MGTKCAVLIDDLPRMLPTKFWFIWLSGFRREEFLEINQSETRIAWLHFEHQKHNRMILKTDNLSLCLNREYLESLFQK
jgi:hypothetical protein